jgi:Major Facilitator Superfamily/Helix-turn-helix domain
MPWKECSVMDERLQFVARRLAGEPMAELCREFGISRKTGYKIFDRYPECGVQELTDRSRRPYRYAHQLPFQVENFILNVKREHTSWGARKVVASFLMLAGSMSDHFGRRRLFQIGLAVFTIGSLLCSRAGTIEQLIGFRALQGFGASMLNPVALSIIANAFPEPKARARAVGIWGGVAGVSLGIGPLIGRALTETNGVRFSGSTFRSESSRRCWRHGLCRNRRRHERGLSTRWDKRWC